MKLYGGQDDIPTATSARLLERAWYLRQRDPASARGLLAEIEAKAPPGSGGVDPAQRARIGLIRAEIHWLFARLGEMQAELGVASRLFEAANDRRGQGDALVLEHHLAGDLGDKPRRRACLREARRLYEAYGDQPRRLTAMALLALDESFDGVDTTLREIELHERDDDTPAAADGLISFSRAQLECEKGGYVAAQEMYQLAATQLMDFGLIRTSIAALINAANALGNMNDVKAQVEKLHEAIAMARNAGWPQSMGASLYCMGDAHHTLGRLADARQAFEEARQWLLPLRNGRTAVVVVSFLAEVTARMGAHAQASEIFADALSCAEAGEHEGLKPRILIGQAGCLAELGAGPAAAQAAMAALAVTEGRDQVTERLALLCLARLHGRFALPPPTGMSAPTASLHYLEQIAAMAQAGEGDLADEEELAEFAAAWERAGNFEQALTYERRRLKAALNERNIQAEQQLLTIQARHEAVMAQKEIAHQHRLREIDRERLLFLERLGEIGREITTMLTTDDIIAAVHRHLAATLKFAVLTIWLDEGGTPATAFRADAGKPAFMSKISALSLQAAQAPAAAPNEREIVVDQPQDDITPHWIASTFTLASVVVAPLETGDRRYGGIAIQSETPHAYGGEERFILQNIAAYMAVALSNASYHHRLRESHARLLAAQTELEELSRQDALTGLFNRRHFLTLANREVSRAREPERPLSILLLDLDHFKIVNDSHGHAAGDLALRTVAQTVKENLRPHDVVARYGGEELVVLLPGTSVSGAAEIAERLRKLVSLQTIEVAEAHFCITVSIGIASWFDGEQTIDVALNRADRAMYEAKRRGRDQVFESRG